MDLKKILGNVENHEELIRQIEAEVGKEFVPRKEFNEKNTALKNLQQELDTTKAGLETLTNEKATQENTVAELNAKISGYEANALKARIAHEMGIPYELATRLSGDDEEAIRADAESLSGYIAGKQVPPLKDPEPAAASGEDAAYKTLLTEIKGE